jgi:hypothetical protein
MPIFLIIPNIFSALPDRIIDRIFSAAVIRTPAEQRTIMQPGRQQPIEAIGFEGMQGFLKKLQFPNAE